MTDDDVLARALKNATLAKALAKDPDDLFQDIAERLCISTAQARRLAATLLDNLTAPVDDKPTLH